MAEYGLTNTEMVAYLGLPSTIIDDLRTAQGTKFTQTANQFIEALVNKIVYQTVANWSFENPFKKYDSFPITYGDTIENIATELPEGYKFNPDATNPFAKAKPSVKVLYATINYELQYKVTIEDSLLRRAVLSEYGFMSIVNKFIADLTKAMSMDEYFAQIATFSTEGMYANGYETLTLPAGATAEQKGSIVAHKIVDVVGDFALPGSDNNALKYKNVSSKGDILLVIKQSLLNTINLDYLAGVYNLSKVDLLNNIIPVKEFLVEQKGTDGTITKVGEDLDFIIIDTKGFDNHVALQDSGMIYNPEGKYTNHYTNLWKIISFKQFYNARAYKITEAQG